MTGAVALLEESSWVSLEALTSLIHKADPACIGGVLRSWTPMVYGDWGEELFDRGCKLIDGLAQTVPGAAELRRLEAEEDDDIAFLARSFVARASPNPKRLADLREALIAADDVDEARYRPASELLAGRTATAEPLLPQPQHGRLLPAWVTLPQRPAGKPPLFVHPPPPHFGWDWLDTPQVIPGDHDEPWSDLPVVAKLDGHYVRWAGPLVESEHVRQLTYRSEISAGRGCLMGFLDDPFEVDDVVNPQWARALIKTARTLAGSSIGHDDEVEIWLAWLGFELAEPHGAIRGRIELQD